MYWKKNKDLNAPLWCPFSSESPSAWQFEKGSGPCQAFRSWGAPAPCTQAGKGLPLLDLRNGFRDSCGLLSEFWLSSGYAQL